jgi:hypothetical protein
MFYRFALVLALVAGFGTTRGDDKKDDKTTKVTGTAIIPKDLPSFSGRTLELRLYAHDPRVADRAADLVEKVEVKDFKHETGTETKKEFTIGAKGELKPNMKYYVTAFVLDGEKRTHIGQADHVKEPFNKVITDGNPREITVRFKEVGKK